MTVAVLSTGPDQRGLGLESRGMVAGMGWAYIIECADGSYYVGSTVDLERRISQHNLGLGATYTVSGD